MNPLNWQRELGREGHRVLFSGQPVAMHCHHYNINLQKTLEDTLGDEGVRLIFQSAEEATYDSFHTLLNQYEPIKTPKSKFEMAALMYQNAGLGVIRPQELQTKFGVYISPASHHVTGWLAKHGRRSTPGCHFTRGWLAGILAVIYDKPIGHYTVAESRCKMMRDKECQFEAKER